MPFTFAHPVIILPLCRLKKELFSVTGLVVGSMVPDFEFFFRMKIGPNIGHHFLGIFVFDLPVALILCFVYHNILRDLLFSQLPFWFQRRLGRYSRFKWNDYAFSHKLCLLTSILIGILSHFFWDAFTHDDGYFVGHFSYLRNSFSFNGNDVPVYALLQVVFSVWGLWIMYRVIASLPKDNANFTTVYQNNWMYWIYMGLISILILTVRIIVLPENRTFWDIFMAGMGSSIYSLCLVSFVYRTSLKVKVLE